MPQELDERFWSDYIQTTEELYRSRALRFRAEDAGPWLRAIGAEDGQRVLEVGCAGGLMCHRLKTALPRAAVTGLDLDAGHIEYARAKTRELGLDCAFVRGDALALPFADGSFDLCYSYTVVEHLPREPFLAEQRRVLAPGGRLTVLSVRSRLGLSAGAPEPEGEERALMEKAWSGADAFERAHPVGAYELGDEHALPRELERAGPREVAVRLFTVVPYAPDSADTPPERALEQIEVERLHSRMSVRKAERTCPGALTETERARLLALIDARYDERVRKYRAGARVWDFSISTVLAVTGIK